MSKSGTHSTGHKRKKGAHADVRRTTSDRAIYIGLLIIGGFIVFLGLLLSAGDGSLAGWFAFGYLLLIAWVANTAAFAAYRGRALSPWRQALARLPLRCAGFGTRGGKPLSAAHDAPAARKMVIVSVVVSIVVLLVLAHWLVPEIHQVIGGG